MLFYGIIWVVLLFFFYTRPKNGIIYYLIILFLVILSGIRDSTIGTDTPTYEKLFGWISNQDAQYIEPGWYYVNRVIYLLGGNFTLLLTIASILTFLPIIYVSNHYKAYRYEILFLYYSMYLYLNSYNGIRQYLAVSIGLITFELIRLKERKWKIVLSIIVAVMFHYTAVFLAIAPFADKIQLKKYFVFVILFVTFIIGSIASLSFFEVLSGKYASYLFKDEYGFRESTASIYILTILMNIIFIFVLLYRSKKFEDSWLKQFFIGIALLNLTFRIALAARLILYYTVAQIFVFPLFLHNNKIKNKFVVYFIVIIYFSMLFYRNFWDGATGGDIVPYKSVLFE